MLFSGVVRFVVLAGLGFGMAALMLHVLPALPQSVSLAASIALVAVPALLFGWRRSLEALEKAARDSIQLVAVCACAGIIVGVVALTGVGGRFSELILTVAGANQLLAMVFAAMVALVLGMGMPTTAAYAIAAAVIAPGLSRMGVQPLVAHMFVFYFAVISAITPPVALASFAAAGMAQADPWKTSWIAVKFGLATFLVPFMFYYSPVLLMQGEWPAIAQAVVTAAIGVWFLAGASEGWFGGRLAMPLRLAMAVAALCMLHPGSFSDLLGLGIGVPIYAYQRMRGGGTAQAA
jgi:TRAP transporter 4TM/12TM fusion protein